MKIEPGYWRCRNGRKARVLCVDAPGGYPVVGYVIANGVAQAASWDASGRHIGDNVDNVIDLIEPWKEPVRVSGWCVVNPAGEVVSQVMTKQQAASFGCSAIVGYRLVYVTGTEGVGPGVSPNKDEGDGQ